MTDITAEQFWDSVRVLHPDRSDEWLALWAQRLVWYHDHDGDMTGAPELPEED